MYQVLFPFIPYLRNQGSSFFKEKRAALGGIRTHSRSKPCARSGQRHHVQGIALTLCWLNSHVHANLLALHEPYGLKMPVPRPSSPCEERDLGMRLSSGMVN